jgi:hypothetical protein
LHKNQFLPTARHLSPKIRKFHIRQVEKLRGKQLFLNCVLTAIAHDGPEMWDYLFDLGAGILGPALMAGEPGVPAAAARPLRKRFKSFNETIPTVIDEEEIAVPSSPRPLPSTKLGINKPAGRAKREG